MPKEVPDFYRGDGEYAHSRLRDSVVLKGGFPVYILSVRGRSVSYFVCGDPNRQTHSCTLEELDVRPIQLGYANCDRDAVFVSRVPARRYIQGLRPNAVMVKGADRGFDVASAQIINLARGIYPTLSSCVEQIECGEAVSRAFSRTFAIGGKKKFGFLLKHKDKVVGAADTQKGIPQYELATKYGYLKEELESCLR